MFHLWREPVRVPESVVLNVVGNDHRIFSIDDGCFILPPVGKEGFLEDMIKFIEKWYDIKITKENILNYDWTNDHSMKNFID